MSRAKPRIAWFLLQLAEGNHQKNDAPKQTKHIWIFELEIDNFVKIIIMRILGFGRRVRPKEFLYIPQHYDEQKERLEEMLSEADPNDEGGAEAVKARIKHSLSYRPYYYDKNNTASKLRKKANIRTLIISFILIGVFFYFLSLYAQDLNDFVK